MPLRAVLVDDVPELRAVLAQALQLRGDFTVVGEAGDGQTAIELAREQQPDLVVLDLGLPDLRGRDVLTGIRAAAPGARVVVYSGSHTSDRAFITSSVDAYIEKTQDVRYVVELIHDVGQRIPREATLRLDTSSHEVALSRHFVVERCIEWGRPQVADDAAVVASELVANALVHVRSSCELTVGLRGDVLRVSVVDCGGGMPDLRNATLQDEHGRGLLLVSILCSAWGTEPREDGKTVWAELDAPVAAGLLPQRGPRGARSARNLTS